MRDEIDRVVAGHVLLLQEVGGVAFAFGKDRDQHICTGHFGPARGLDVDRGALDDALKGRRGYCFGPVDIGDEVGQVVLDEFKQGLAQVLDLHRTGLHDARGVGFIDQRQQQMLQRCKFVSPRVGQGQCSMYRLL